MKKTLGNNIIIIAFFFMIYSPLMFLSLYKMEYTVTSPGYNDEVEGFIKLETEYEQVGSFHTTSVFVIDEITLLQKLIGDLDYRIEVEPFPDYYNQIDIDDIEVLGYLQKDESIQNSLIVAARNSNILIEYETFPTVYLTFNYLEEDTLELGDKIITVNGNTEFRAGVDEAECGSLVEFVIEREDETLTFMLEKKVKYDCGIGIYVKNFTEIISTDLVYEIIETNTGGSSGGLMQSLYIYNRLTQNDITSGLKVAGTGTINIDGDVGAIGGIEQKILTSHYNGMDIFFVPHLSDSENDNYIKALTIYNKLDTDMILVPVSSFEEALNYLLALEEDN